MLLTLGDLEDRRRYLNVTATLDRLLTLGVVPVINENDTVATTEIRFGDNDRLAARTAQAAGAAGVVLLSDVDGLYTANPSRDPSATLIPLVETIDAVEAAATGDSASGLGSGGMASKVAAAKLATTAGIALAIADGRRLHPLKAFLATSHGTVFTARAAARARKTWLAGRLTVAGRLNVDAGALAALRQGKSLLAAGVIGVEGAFQRGEVVAVAGPDGTVAAHGLVAYDAGDAMTIKGLRNDRQEAALGYTPRSAMIHRDQLVLL